MSYWFFLAKYCETQDSSLGDGHTILRQVHVGCKSDLMNSSSFLILMSLQERHKFSFIAYMYMLGAIVAVKSLKIDF